MHPFMKEEHTMNIRCDMARKTDGNFKPVLTSNDAFWKMPDRNESLFGQSLGSANDWFIDHEYWTCVWVVQKHEGSQGEKVM